MPSCLTADFIPEGWRLQFESVEVQLLESIEFAKTK